MSKTSRFESQDLRLISDFHVTCHRLLYLFQLENVAIANALQLEAARRRVVPIRFNFVADAKFEVALPIRNCCLRAFLLLICYVTLWPWTMTLWLWSLTLNICSIPFVPWSNSVPNLSAIEQSAAESLRFEYLTLWPWTCITCCAMLWNSLHKV